MSIEHSPARQRWRHVRAAPPRLALSVNEFCDAHGISRTHLYDMWREGGGPRYMIAGGKRLISAEAALDWRVESERAALTHPHSKRGGRRRPSRQKDVA
jgi:hypothetical protein